MDFSEDQKIDICVKVLEDFLHKCKKEERERHLINLRNEKEGWVEYQLAEWAAKEIEKRYRFVIWDVSYYFSTELWQMLDKKF